MAKWKKQTDRRPRAGKTKRAVVILVAAVVAVFQLACSSGDGPPPEWRCERARGKVAELVEYGFMTPPGAEPRGVFFLRGGGWRDLKPFGETQYALGRELLAYARCGDPATETVHIWDTDYRGGKLASFSREHVLTLHYSEPSMKSIIEND